MHKAVLGLETWERAKLDGGKLGEVILAYVKGLAETGCSRLLRGRQPFPG